MLNRRLAIEPLFIVVLAASTAAPVQAQLRARRGEPAAVEAYVGEPFGVGRVTVPLSPADAGIVHGIDAFLFEEQDGRMLYPAISTARLLAPVRELLGRTGNEAPGSLTAFFLFTGTEPLRLTFLASSSRTVTLAPRHQPRLHVRLLRRWWREYSAMVRQQHNSGDYPPQVETYLTTMLSQRLGLEPVLLDRLQDEQSTTLGETLGLLAGTEKLRDTVLQETLSGFSVDSGLAELPVPPSVQWPEQIVPPSGEQADVEPIAMHVPQECFYIRFGSFENYLWLTQLLEDYGGDISSMVKLRGFNAHLNERSQRQLALKQSAMAEIFGGQVISDVAMIGRDTYLREGPAMGILFEARNPLLGADILKQRNEALAREKANGAAMTSVKIAGHDVSFLRTPGNELRSYYAVNGDYHLVTTTKAIVERFYEAGTGDRSLGSSAEFQNARITLPRAREDTIFVYMSSAFFQGLVSPQYQIELRRRLRAVAEIESVQLARLASRAEGKTAETPVELVRNGLLPRGFGQRPDGSQLVVDGETLTDSLRGQRGSFLPVPDVEIHAVTRDEANRIAGLTAFQQTQWRQMDPLMIALKRYALDEPDLERVAVDAWMLPFNAKQYGTVTSVVGPPTNASLAPVPGDVISVQAVLKGGSLNPSVAAHHMFFGLQDMAPSPTRSGGKFLQTLRLAMSSPGYLGAWPKPGWLDLLPVGLSSEPDAFGFSLYPLGLWRRQFDGYSVLSFSRPVLDYVTPELTLEETDNFAQMRVDVADLSQSKISGWLSQMNYERSRLASIGNARFLHLLSQQLRVPREDARTVVEQLLDVELLCTLGGEYELQQPSAGLKYWASTAWEQSSAAWRVMPADYQAPALAWFRGATADMTMHEDKLIVHAEIDMKRKPRDAKIELPLFNLFGGAKKTQDKGIRKPVPEKDSSVEPLPEELPPPKNQRDS